MMQIETSKPTETDELPLWEVIDDPATAGLFIGFGETRNGKFLQLTSTNKPMLEEYLLRMQLQNADDGEDRFLAAWKLAVKVRPNLFHCDANSIDDATDKEQLRPNWDAVEGFLRSKPEPWLRKFIMGVCSFYNDEWMHEWAKRLRLPRSSVGNLAIRLDMEHREILADLLTSYRGW